jgi:hypothetical protein
MLVYRYSLFNRYARSERKYMLAQSVIGINKNNLH